MLLSENNLKNETYRMKNVNTKKFNVVRDGKRTSLTIDKLVADLFCVYLGCNQYADNAHKVVEQGIQRIIEDGHVETLYKSKMIQDMILLKLCHDETRQQFNDNIAENLKK